MPRKIEVEIIADADKYRRGLKDADSKTQGFGSSLKGMSKVAGLAIGAAAIGGLTVGLKSVVGAAKDAEEAQLRLEDAMKSANVSYKAHDEQIGKTIQSVSRLAAVDDEDLSDAFSKLVRTSGDVKGSLEGMSLATDIAAARGISLEAATKLVEKAMMGNENAFKKVGLEMQKNATAQETLAAAQEKFGGAAEKHGQSAAAAQERLSIAFENLQEKIGQKLLPVFADLMTKLSEVVTWVETHWPEIEQEFSRSMENVKKIIDKIKPILQTIIDQIVIVAKLIKAIVDGDWSEVWNQLKAAAVNAVKLIGQLVRLEFEVIKGVLKELGKKALEGLEAGVKGLANVVLDEIRALPGQILALGKLLYNAALSLGQKVVSGIADGLRGAADAVAGAIGSAVAAAINFLIDRVNSALEIKIPVPFGPDIHIDPPNIGHVSLAKGGIVNRPTMALIGEAGPEAVVPLNRGGGMGTTVNVTVQGALVGSSVQEVANTIRRELLRVQGRNNSPIFGT